MKNIICKYCNQQSSYCPIGASYLYIYYCYPCNAEYTEYRGNIWSHSLYATFNDKTYSLTTDNLNIKRLYLIGLPGIPGVRLNERKQLIHSFNETLDDIIPSNIKDKIQLWLTFL